MNKRDDCRTVAECIERNTGMSAKDFLTPKESYEIYNLKEGYTLLRDAFKTNRHIFVMADYDVDGISSGCIFEFLFQALGYENYRIRFPKRFSEGYGIRESVIDEIPEGALLITVDNGITAIKPMKKAKEKQISVLIVDHHKPKTDEEQTMLLPMADVIIDPHATHNCTFSYYCGAGLAYRLCSLFLRKGSREERRMLCMATLATIADVMPLVEENRFLVKEGLRALTESFSRTTGLFALLRSFDMDQYLTPADIGYYIAPAINAMSRMNDDGAHTAFEFLTFDGRLEDAEEHAKIMQKTNLKRRELVAASESRIEQIIEENKLQNDFPLCIYCPFLHEGIIGIIAGNLSLKYKRPAIVFTNANGIYKGSGRTYGGINLFELLSFCNEHFMKWGGHAEAAGMSVRPETFLKLRNSLQDAYRKLDLKVQEEDNTYDLEISMNDLPDIIKELEKYEPFGHGNPMIRFLIKDYRLFYDVNAKGYSKVLGNDKKHIKFFSEKYHAIGFDLAEKYKELHNPLEFGIICTINKNHYVSPKNGKIIITDQLECIDIAYEEKKITQTKAAFDLEMFANNLFLSQKGAAL